MASSLSKYTGNLWTVITTSNLTATTHKVTKSQLHLHFSDAPQFFAVMKIKMRKIAKYKKKYKKMTTLEDFLEK